MRDVRGLFEIVQAANFGSLSLEPVSRNRKLKPTTLTNVSCYHTLSVKRSWGESQRTTVIGYVGMLSLLTRGRKLSNNPQYCESNQYTKTLRIVVCLN
jgi:hypothetical protein